LPCQRLVEVAVGGDDTIDLRHPPRRENADLRAGRYRARRNLAREAAEILVGPVDPLHRHPERLRGIGFGAKRDRIELFQQARPGIPGRRIAPAHDVVAGET